MFEEHTSDYFAELQAVEQAERLATEDLLIESQKWQKDTPCNHLHTLKMDSIKSE